MIERKRIAVTLPMGPDVRDSIDLVRWAEARGFDDVWFSDAMAPDSLTLAARWRSTPSECAWAWR